MAKEVKLPDKTAIPSNWIWVPFGLLTKIISGYPFDSNRFSSKQDSSSPLIRIRDIVRGYTETYTDEDCPNEYIVCQGDVLIGMDGDFNVAKWRNDNGLLNQRVCRIQTDSEALINDFLYYYLPIPLQQINYATPSVTVKHLSTKTLFKASLPLPPVAEQRRIVEYIERLFEKLDRAKELVQNALDSFETRKAAILHKAFCGKLTDEWRKENELKLDSWENKTLKSIAKLRNGYAFDSRAFVNEGYQVVRMGNLYNGILDLTRAPVFISKDSIDENIRIKFTANKNDILLTLTGTKYKRDYGYAVLIENDDGLLVNQRILAITPENIERNLLLYYLCSDFFRDTFFSNETGGVNQGNVSSTFVGDILVPCPSLAEQHEIVRILDNLFEKDQRAHELCDVIDKIDLIKKVILARAFRGELGTNDQGEESALELLKEVLASGTKIQGEPQ